MKEWLLIDTYILYKLDRIVNMVYNIHIRHIYPIPDTEGIQRIGCFFCDILIYEPLSHRKDDIMSKSRSRLAAALCAGAVMAANVLPAMNVYAEDDEKSSQDAAVEMTASMPLRQKLAQMIVLNVRY
jgi:hypothetical protein